MSSTVGHAVQMGLGFVGASRFLKMGGSGGGGEGAPAPGPSTASNNSGPSGPPPSAPPSPALPYSPMGPIAPSSPSMAALSPIPSGSNGLIQSPRGSLAVGRVADGISPQQAQSFANYNGTPFTQAFSSGQVVTYQPAVSRVPAASTFIGPLCLHASEARTALTSPVRELSDCSSEFSRVGPSQPDWCQFWCHLTPNDPTFHRKLLNLNGSKLAEGVGFGQYLARYAPI